MRPIWASAAFVRLVWRNFVLSTIAVPDSGMAALPTQLAGRLPDSVLRLGQRVTGRRGRTVLTEDGSLEARAVLVAADPVTAGALLPLDIPEMHALTTYFHVAPRPPASAPMLWTAPAARWPTRSCSPTRARLRPRTAARWSPPPCSAAPSRCPTVVRGELARLYAVPTHHWAHLHTAEIPARLPAFRPGRGTAVELGDGIFVADIRMPVTEVVDVVGRTFELIEHRARRSVTPWVSAPLTPPAAAAPTRSGWTGWGSSSTSPRGIPSGRTPSARRAGDGPDVLMLLEHPSVYTAGKRTPPETAPTTAPRCRRLHGGLITWNGHGSWSATRSWS